MPNKTAFASFRKNGTTKRKLDDVAKIFGVDKTTILRWEEGRVPIPAKRLKQIEDITGIPRRQLRPDLFEGMGSAA